MSVDVPLPFLEFGFHDQRFELATKLEVEPSPGLEKKADEASAEPAHTRIQIGPLDV